MIRIKDFTRIRIDTLLDKERLLRFVAKSNENCKQRILSRRVHQKEAKIQERKPNEQKKMPSGEKSFGAI